MSTARRWFVPGTEFLTATEDYAIVGQLAASVQNHLLNDWTFDPWEYDTPQEGENRVFSDKLDHPMACGYCFGFIKDPILLYADVDRNDNEHQEMCKAIAEQGFLAEEDEKSKEAQRKLLDHLSTFYEDSDSDGSEAGGDVGENTPVEAKLEDRVASMAEILTRTGFVTGRMIDYLLQLKGEANRRDLLTVLTRQQRRKTQRPVMLLIGTVDKHLGDVKEGWVAAYDFYDNRIIIKPYLADKTQHPLAEKWDIELPDDGISFSGRPSELVGNLLQLQTQLEDEEWCKNQIEDQDKSQILGFRMLVYDSVAGWLLSYWDAVTNIEQIDGETPLKKEDSHKIRKLKHTIGDKTSAIEFHYEDQQSPVVSKSSIPTLRYMQMMLEDYEVNVRSDAIKAKEEGKETVAENAAKLYGQLLEQLQSFNLDPEKAL
ncbi:MAG: hypothetical protein L6R40_005054 [Gallowayella cf. fulva]|nr:MAG: hypothetical protein L6R40_005054 [Xanthomendoza cf. fulva]